MSERAHIWRQELDRARRAWRGSPLPGFFAWWGDALAASLPRRWAAWWRRSNVWCLLTLDGTGLEVRRAGAVEPHARIDTAQAEALQQSALREALAGPDPHDVRLALCLGPGQVLRRTLTLPAAARGDLERVLGYEMDRQTPFRAHEVAYAAHELGRTGDGRLRVELVAVPKARLEPMLAQVRALGVRVDAVDALDGAGRLGVNMLDAAARPSHPHPRRRLNLALAAAAVLLLALAMGQWLHNRRAALATMQAQVDALRNQAQQAAALRRRLVERMGAAGFLARQRVNAPAVIEVLADLTQRLPDDTWLERFGIDASGNVSLQGESPQATHLLKRVGASPYLDDPGFQGAIQTDARTGKERFYMTAQLHMPAHAGSVAEGADAQADAR